MSVMNDFLAGLGINGANVVAGLAGGLVHIFWYKKTTPFEACSALVGGACVAAYVSDAIATHVGLPSGLVGFGLGLLGMQSLAPLIAYAREKLGVKIGE